VTRTLIVALALTLSGAPAAAVVCDLLMCRELKPIAGCHEHAGQDGRERVAATSDSCSHLVAAEPFLLASGRLLACSVAPEASHVAAAVNIAAPSPSANTALSAASPPRTLRAVCLRI
jgi:hypothetical protein